MNLLSCKHWQWLIQNVTRKHAEKWEHCDAAATAQTAMGCHGVVRIWEDSGTDDSSEEALGTTVLSKMMAQNLVNWLLTYQQITVHWNWPYHMDWDYRVPVATATLYEGSVEEL